ncbi:MAG: 5-formyltetrahydrofolate cyclo-ligase [Geminicoccaceae bacterium]|nr:5-formyltetrahydrofolate cyclo-ligase [Geminicoccaceae bacterium]
MSERPKARWAGRDPRKDALRARIWGHLEATGAGIGPVWSRIPDFEGADRAAERLAALPEWRQARTVKCNPDPPQRWIRKRALEEGKLVFTPVPELVRDFPYLRLDPERLIRAGVPFELAATAEGAIAHGERIGFEDAPFLELYVVGSVAVAANGGRTGKGAGFADLEWGFFSALGRVGAQTLVLTSVHELQLVDPAELPLDAHDLPLDLIVTPERAIRTRPERPRPMGVDWDRIRPDQYRDIPFLAELRARMEAAAP